MRRTHATVRNVVSSVTSSSCRVSRVGRSALTSSILPRRAEASSVACRRFPWICRPRQLASDNGPDGTGEKASHAASRLDGCCGPGLYVSRLTQLAARGESPAAFDRRCIPADCVAPQSHTAGIFPRRALSAGRIARLGATRDFHHGLLGHKVVGLDYAPASIRFARREAQKQGLDCEYRQEDIRKAVCGRRLGGGQRDPAEDPRRAQTRRHPVTGMRPPGQRTRAWRGRRKRARRSRAVDLGHRVR